MKDMKKLLSLLLCLAMVLSLAACGGEVEEPDKSTLKKDVQDYITELIDEDAEIEDFEKESSERDGDELEVICIATFGEDETEGTFTLIYELDGKEWVLDKCSVDLDEDKGGKNDKDEDEDEDEDDETEPAETTKPTEPEETTKPTEPAKPDTSEVTLSDDWKDFTFEMDGDTYQLPSHYSNFTANGWKLDGTRSDFTEDYEVPGYTRCYVYLTNGATYFYAQMINMSGNARALSDCDVGSITIQANDNLGLKLAGGITNLSTVDEVQAAYGSPSSISTYDDYSTLKYEGGDYISMNFYIYNEKTTYNEITLTNLVATERDVTVASDKRPDYLDEYVAPTELSSDPTVTAFELDGVLYQLPCPLEQFLNNGWTITRDSIVSVGAGCDEYGMTLKKGDVDIDVTLINFSKLEVTSKNCAVSCVDFSNYDFKDAADGFVKFPGGLTMTSTLEDLEAVLTGFERSDYTSSVTFSISNDDYTVKVRYSIYPEDEDLYISMTNEIWSYK